ncbi:visual pigment-like receptor peropsin [Branchiostoma floridae]|uniref:Visual pigment-like receptor peropsin n=1 Tax=Branchiostoma floridae TaxID=7739 RepID=A0A9J7LSA0_BRAFL|nr:visual pigment-like receptor peropsin [Branchiostoma floridae]
MASTNNTTNDSEWGPQETLGVSATIMGIYLTVVGLVSTVGNATVVLMFMLKWRQLCRKAPNLLIINLAAVDLCISVFGYPFSASSGFANQWLFSDAICTLYGFSCFLLSMVSMCTLCLISIHRYITICRPEHASKLTMTRTILAVVGAWVYGISVAVPPLFGIARYTYESFGLSCTIDFHGTTVADMVYLSILIILCYVINVAVMGTCYFKIIRKFSKHRFREVRDVRTSHQHSFERGVTLRCILMTLFYLISWTPYTAVAVWTMVGPPPPVQLGMVAALTAKTHCAFNPILYMLMSEVYRKLVLRTMCPCCFNKISNKLVRLPADDSKHSGNLDIFTVGYNTRDQAVQINKNAARRFCFVMETASDDLGIDDEVFAGQLGLCSRVKATEPGVEGFGGSEVPQSPSGTESEWSLSLLDFLPKRSSSKTAKASSLSETCSDNTVLSSAARKMAFLESSHQQSDREVCCIENRQAPEDTKPCKFAIESLGVRLPHKCCTASQVAGAPSRYAGMIETFTDSEGKTKEKAAVSLSEIDVKKPPPASKTWERRKTSKNTSRGQRVKRTFGKSRKHAYIVDC